jgi:hypothetical protein
VIGDGIDLPEAVTVAHSARAVVPNRAEQPPAVGIA